MDDLISRQAAIDAMFNFHECYGRRYAEIDLEEFDALPSAQPERKPGHWEIYIISMFDGEGCRCSECGFEGAPYWDFCPNCGADMRGEQDETD